MWIGQVHVMKGQFRAACSGMPPGRLRIFIFNCSAWAVPEKKNIHTKYKNPITQLYQKHCFKTCMFALLQSCNIIWDLSKMFFNKWIISNLPVNSECKLRWTKQRSLASVERDWHPRVQRRGKDGHLQADRRGDASWEHEVQAETAGGAGRAWRHRGWDVDSSEDGLQSTCNGQG